MKPITILLLIMLVLAGYVSANAGEKLISNNLTSLIDTSEFAENIDVNPVIIGGVEALISKIKYPESAKEAKIEGYVYVRVFLDEKGNVVGTKIERGVSGDLDKAAIKAIKETKFKPGELKGHPAKVQIVIPIQFKLQ